MITYMPSISVITAVYQPVEEYIREAAVSVATRRLPIGWDLEWLVQEDGDAPVPRACVTEHFTKRTERVSAPL
jgi:hypothetical protein